MRVSGHPDVSVPLDDRYKAFKDVLNKNLKGFD
jgi:hypothetical protein